MIISIFGLGYVGTVSAACLASKGHIVCGVDISPEKVAKINAGSSPVVEPGLSDKIKESIHSKNLKATTDPEEALSHSELSLLAVATPSKNNGQIDPTYLLRACKQIAQVLSKLNRKQIVIIRSSVLPEVFEECGEIFKRLAPDLVELCVNPEFLREGTAIKDFEDPPFTIIGTENAAVEKKLCQLYAGIDAPIYVLGPKEATMVKYASNVYHALKVAFANELGALCKVSGIDSNAVMSVFVQDRKLNISTKYLNPGFAFGGSCLPKDIRAVLYAGKQSDVELPLIQSILQSNTHLIEKTCKRILDYGEKRVGMIGLSFKSHTDDLRESPFVELAERLLGKGIDLAIYDPNVSLSRLTGANKAYIEGVIPHLSKLLVSSLDELVKHSALIIVGHKFEGVANLSAVLKPTTTIVDCCNIAELKSCAGKYDGINW